MSFDDLAKYGGLYGGEGALSNVKVCMYVCIYIYIYVWWLCVHTAGIFLENKFRGDKSSLSKIEGGRT